MIINFNKLFALAALVLTGSMLTAQTNERYARVQISLENKTMAELAALGLETDHGIYLQPPAIRLRRRRDCNYKLQNIDYQFITSYKI